MQSIRFTAPAVLTTALLLASPSGAYEPPPTCNGLTIGAEERQALSASTLEYDGYMVHDIAPGWVLYQHRTSFAVSPVVVSFILESCTAQVRLLAQVIAEHDGRSYPESTDRIIDEVNDIIRKTARETNPETYSLYDIATLVRAAGASTRVGDSPYSSCACDYWAEYLQ